MGTWRDWNAEGALLRVTTHQPDGLREDEVFAVYAHAPEGAPRPVDAAGARAPEEPLRCPEGARVVREELTLGVGGALQSLDDSGGPTSLGERAQEAVLGTVLNAIRVPLVRVEACAVGRIAPKKEGPAVLWALEGGERVADGFFLDGESHGRWQMWGAKGRPAARVDYAEGKRHGVAVEWHEGGGPTRSVPHFAEGVHHGPFATWWPNGAYRVTGAYRHGKPHGE